MHGQYLFCFTVAWGKAVNDVNKVGENAISMVFFYLCHTVKRDHVLTFSRTQKLIYTETKPGFYL